MLDIKNIESILEAIHEGIMIVDSDYMIRFYNNAMGKIDGYLPSEVLGKNYFKIFPQQTYESSTILPAFKEKKRTVNEVQSYVTSKGKRNSLITTTIPIIEDGQVVAVVETCKDISVERKLFNDILDMQNVINKKSNQGTGGSICKYHFSDIIGQSRPLLDVVQRAQSAAATDSFVLISGETGTGKELFAQSIHNASERRNQPFVAINCAALPRELLEGILFGTTRGGFTGSIDRAGVFEEANHGTLLLDEVDSMDPYLQGKLLRVIQEGVVRRVGGSKDIRLDIRIISASNTNMEQAMGEKRFRSDLFYRLSVVNLTIPPLRDRGDDILYLKDYYINHFNMAFEKNVRGVSDEVRDVFMSYYWPGNVREIKHCIEGAMNIIGDDSYIRLSHLPAGIIEKVRSERSPKPEGKTYTPAVLVASPPQQKDSLRSATDMFERSLIIETLESCQGNVSKAAELLEIKRQTLQYKMKKLGIGKDNLSVHYKIEHIIRG